MARRRKFKKTRLGYMGTGKNVPLTFEILRSEAWKALKPSQKLVLIDWFEYYVRLSHWDTEPLEEGMSYTFGHCNVDVTETTFLTAVKRIVEVGFFKRAVNLESGCPGSPRIFLPSKNWYEFRQSDDERNKREASKRRKKRRLDDKRTRRKSFRASLTEKNEPQKSMPTRPQKSMPIRSSTTPKKYADTLPESNDSHP